jgi:hypothetical protein
MDGPGRKVSRFFLRASLPSSPVQLAVATGRWAGMEHPTVTQVLHASEQGGAGADTIGRRRKTHNALEHWNERQGVYTYMCIKQRLSSSEHKHVPFQLPSAITPFSILCR